MKHEVQLTPKPILTIYDLKNTDHVGFISGNNIKGYISFTYPLYHGVSSNSNDWQSEAYGNFGIGKKDLIGSILECKNTIYGLKSIYKFDTRKELYKWLAED